ncbi:MAG TPA: potassium transporter TrkG [Acholeplasma sp.]|nr:potassium transporter TrkG [Acholeplasma sp.]
MNIYRQIKKVLFKTPARTIFMIYLAFAIVSGILLWLPISLNKGVELKYIDALFIAISALASAGLTPTPLYETFNLFGGIITLLIIQIGGLGIVLLVASYWVISGKKIGLRERSIIAAEQNQFTVRGIIKLISNALIAILVIQLIYFVVMSFYLYYKQPFDLTPGGAIFHAAFLSASSFANAGFEMFPTMTSFRVFQEQHLYFPQYFSMILIFLGGVGFWPLAEITLFFKALFKKKKHKMSYVSKLFIYSHLFILLGTAVIYTALEYQNSLRFLSVPDAVTNVLFMSTSVRSAGFTNTANVAWTESTKLFMTVLMFIGAAPNSSGGGVRMTTMILVVATLISYGRHKKQVKVANKAIKEAAIKRALMVFSMGIVLVFVSTFLVSIAEPGQSLTTSAFEVSSAFGTVGLTLNFTHQISNFTKIILMINMFIGRIGILTFLAMLDNKKSTNVVTYAEIDMMVG